MSIFTGVVFSIRARSDAHILLSEQPVSSDYNLTENFVEVVIGGWANTKSLIRIEDLVTEENRIETPYYLDGDSFNDFWITWGNNVIRVGRGLQAGAQMFMEKEYPSTINLNRMAIFSGYGSDGTWKIRTGTVSYNW